MFPLQMLCTVLLNGNLRPCPKPGLPPSPELKGIQLPRVQPVPSLSCSSLAVCCLEHTWALLTPHLMRKGVFLCLQTCSIYQVTSEHPWGPLTLLEAALFLASFLLPRPLLASLPPLPPCCLFLACTHFLPLDLHTSSPQVSCELLKILKKSQMCQKKNQTFWCLFRHFLPLTGFYLYGNYYRVCRPVFPIFFANLRAVYTACSPCCLTERETSVKLP